MPFLDVFWDVLLAFYRKIKNNPGYVREFLVSEVYGLNELLEETFLYSL